MRTHIELVRSSCGSGPPTAPFESTTRSSACEPGRRAATFTTAAGTRRTSVAWVRPGEISSDAVTR